MRINITIDPGTVRLADRLARRRKISRSALLRAGVKALAENETLEAKNQAQRERRRRAAEALDRLAHQFGDWPAEEIVRAWRYRSEGRKE